LKSIHLLLGADDDTAQLAVGWVVEIEADEANHRPPQVADHAKRRSSRVIVIVIVGRKSENLGNSRDI